MTWFKVDDGFYDHPKVHDLRSGPCYQDSLALWLLAGSWSARYLTDGVVPEHQVKRLGIKRAAAQELVRVGLWETTASGYVFHEWTEHQPARDEVKTRRRAVAERVRRHRSADRNGVSNALQGIRARSPYPDLPEKPEADVAPQAQEWLDDGKERAARSECEDDVDAGLKAHLEHCREFEAAIERGDVIYSSEPPETPEEAARRRRLNSGDPRLVDAFDVAAGTRDPTLPPPPWTRRR